MPLTNRILDPLTFLFFFTLACPVISGNDMTVIDLEYPKYTELTTLPSVMPEGFTIRHNADSLKLFLDNKGITRSKGCSLISQLRLDGFGGVDVKEVREENVNELGLRVRELLGLSEGIKKKNKNVQGKFWGMQNYGACSPPRMFRREPPERKSTASSDRKLNSRR
jgi:hypothetical protein